MTVELAILLFSSIFAYWQLGSNKVKRDLDMNPVDAPSWTHSPDFKKKFIIRATWFFIPIIQSYFGNPKDRYFRVVVAFVNNLCLWAMTTGCFYACFYFSDLLTHNKFLYIFICTISLFIMNMFLIPLFMIPFNIFMAIISIMIGKVFSIVNQKCDLGD